MNSSKIHDGHSAPIFRFAALLLLTLSQAHAVVISPAIVPPPVIVPPPIFSFESGLDDWEVSGFNAQPVILGTSPTGATHGAQALAITQGGPGFSYDAHVTAFRNTPGSTDLQAFYLKMNNASLNENQWAFALDVTYRDAEIPSLPQDPSRPSDLFLNTTFWINSANGFRAYENPITPGAGLATTNTKENTTIHLFIPFADFAGTDELATNSFFYELGIGINGNWASGPATIHVDSIDIVPVPEPLPGVFGLGILGVTLTHRRRGQCSR